jgi:hypothetical protein
MALSQLLYISDSIDVICLDDLLEIQRVSIRNNALNHITGILLYADGNFVQFLEGQRSDILDLFDTICLDSRHENVRLIYERPADRRHFGDWDMAMLDLELHNDTQRDDFRKLIYFAMHPEKRNGHAPMDLVILNRFRDLLLSI